MTQADVIASVERAVRSPGHTPADLQSLMDEARKYVAARILMEALESSGEFTAQAGVYMVPVPATWNYDRALVSATVEGKDIAVLNSIEQLRRHAPTFDSDRQIGDIKYVTEHLGQLVYYPLPREDTTIKCFFHRTIDLNEDLYEYPEGLAKSVLKAYMCWQMFSDIEDGVDGSKVNTTYWQSVYNQEIEYLEQRISSGQSRPFPERTSSWI